MAPPDRLVGGGAAIIGRSATGAPALSEPKGLARDAAGPPLRPESGGEPLTIFNTDGTVATSFGKAGTGDGEFKEPWGVTVAPSGDVYVADTWNHRIQKFDADGRFVHQWGSFARHKGPADGRAGQLLGPAVVAIGSEGNVYVTDTGNKRIQVFDPNGRFVRAVGTEGSEPGQFRSRWGWRSTARATCTWPTPGTSGSRNWTRQVARSRSLRWRRGAAGDHGQALPERRSDGPHLRHGAGGAPRPDGRQRWARAPGAPTADYGLQMPIGVLAGPEDSLWVSDSRGGVVVYVPSEGRRRRGRCASGPERGGTRRRRPGRQRGTVRWFINTLWEPVAPTRYGGFREGF